VIAVSEARQEAAVVTVLAPVAGALAVTHATAGVAEATAGRSHPLAAVLVLAISAVLLAAAAALSHWRPDVLSRGHGHALALTLCGISTIGAAAAAALSDAFSAGPVAAMALTLAAAGGVLVIRRWALAAGAAVWAGWLVAVLAFSPAGSGDSLAALAGASATAAALYTVRVRTLDALAQADALAEAAAVRDPLTGLTNRRGPGHARAARSSRHGPPSGRRRCTASSSTSTPSPWSTTRSVATRATRC
jgi:hypothetical protein